MRTLSQYIIEASSNTDLLDINDLEQYLNTVINTGAFRSSDFYKDYTKITPDDFPQGINIDLKKINIYY